MGKSSPDRISPGHPNVSIIPNCRDMSRLTSEGLDRPHSWVMRVRMAVHLLFCQLCRRYARQLRWLHCAGEIARETAHPEVRLPESKRNQLKAGLHQELAVRPSSKAN